MKPMAYSDREWYKAKRRVANWLTKRGVSVAHAGQGCDFDLFTPKMTRIKVRWGMCGEIEFKQPRQGWVIDIHRSGLLRENDVDFYVLLLDVTESLRTIGIHKPIYVVLRSPLRKPVLTITTRHLITGEWAGRIDNWKLIKEFDGKKQ
jgi:hypothetical protein